jgi:hypothetical protein
MGFVVCARTACSSARSSRRLPAGVDHGHAIGADDGPIGQADESHRTALRFCPPFQAALHKSRFSRGRANFFIIYFLLRSEKCGHRVNYGFRLQGRQFNGNADVSFEG